ncbi:hypothetical protein BKA62DRAFT_675231 [Auriculariales sp. MPI-PUGE-AT-0066]|nr:hypothetical protein BKA62DRAFT_675231 [Auriculariales sp. MPI-PUGE-AT-0066]
MLKVRSLFLSSPLLVSPGSESSNSPTYEEFFLTCHRNRLQNDPTWQDLQAQIRRGASHIRGAIVGYVRSNAPTDFGFSTLTKDEVKLFGKRFLYPDNPNFLHSVHFCELDRQGNSNRYKLFGNIIERKGAYRHPLIESTIREVFFQGSEPLGVEFPDAFNPMPFVTVALVATAMECALYEWQEGTRKRCDFTAEKFGGSFQARVEALERSELSHRHESIAWRCALFKKCSSLQRENDGDAMAAPVVHIDDWEFDWNDDLDLGDLELDDTT